MDWGFSHRTKWGISHRTRQRRVVDFGEIALHAVSGLDAPQRAAAVARRLLGVPAPM
jgi:hypothetical protein